MLRAIKRALAELFGLGREEGAALLGEGRARAQQLTSFYATLTAPGRNASRQTFCSVFTTRETHSASADSTTRRTMGSVLERRTPSQAPPAKRSRSPSR